MSRKFRRSSRPPEALASVMEVSMAEINALIERGRSAPLSAEDGEKIRAMGETLVFLKGEWQARGAAIKRLLETLFGARTEKNQTVLGEPKPAEPSAAAEAGPRENRPGERAALAPRPGHGRNGAAALIGAYSPPGSSRSDRA
jgi:hypothetical protein